MLDEYLALGGVELGNNARAFAYASCLSCCAGLLKCDGCAGLHDATNPSTAAVWDWVTQRTNFNTNPRMDNLTTGWTVANGTVQTAVAGGSRLDWASGVAADNAIQYQTAQAAALPGEQWTASVEITVPPGYPTLSFYLGTLAYTAVGASVLPLAMGAVVSIAPGQTKRVYSSVLTAPATTAGMRSILYPSTAIPSGARAFIRNAILERSPVVDAPYFDGATAPAGVDPAFVRTLWNGTANASASVLQNYQIITPATSLEPPYSCEALNLAPWFDLDNPFSQEFAGSYLLSIQGITDSTQTAPITEGIDDGGIVGAARNTTRSVRVRTMLVGCGSAAAEYGLAWMKAALGSSFCSRHGDGCGTSDLAFFIDCPPALDPGDTDYDALVAPYRRYLHGVACTSGPVIADQFETPSGAYVIVIEFILTAESPFVWGETEPITPGSTVRTAYDDIPFNLMRRPSAEQNTGTPAVVATQYAFNGSAEYGGSASTLPTGWGNSVTSIPAGITVAKSTDIAAVGANSARVRLLATGTIVNGQVVLYHDVSLTTMPGGARPSLSMWAAAIIFAGAPTVGLIQGAVEWRTASAFVSETAIGTIPANGGNLSATGLVIPATATIARLKITFSDIDAVSGDDIRFYADALGLTIP